MLALAVVLAGCAALGAALRTSATYAQLTAAFGPRPRGLNVSRGASPFDIPGWVVALVVTIGIVVVAAAIAIAIIVIRRTRPRQNPTWTPGT